MILYFQAKGLHMIEPNNVKMGDKFVVTHASPKDNDAGIRKGEVVCFDHHICSTFASFSKLSEFGIHQHTLYWHQVEPYIDYKMMLKAIEHLVQTDFCVDMSMHLCMKKFFSQEDAQHMAQIIGNIYSIAHAIDCKACQKQYTKETL